MTAITFLQTQQPVGVSHTRTPAPDKRARFYSLFPPCPQTLFAEKRQFWGSQAGILRRATADLQQKIAFAAKVIIFAPIMNVFFKLRCMIGLVVLASMALCFGAGVSVGIYQPNGVNAAVLPELFKPWAAAAGFTVTILKPEEVRMGKFKNVDVLAIADAESHTAVINPDADEKKAIQAFVFAGGGYIGICGGCTLALDSNTGLGLLPLKAASVYGIKRGPVPVKLQMTKLTQTILGDDRKFVDATFEEGPVLEAQKQRKLPRRFDHIGLFWEANGAATGKKNPLAFMPAVVSCDFGKGRVVGFCIHPERTTGCEGWLPSAIRWAAGKK